ncbi:aminotransferase class I/II-fold pyridoxal phosphate-dependent enzyme [Novosphingobium piscinae]|uniref:Aminotransferase class I/II-fold pyridoxal phosphate-dependent enzyme n=1 Tax=Novosphingobium piscinae TaxID=1507448 RepID=A0A7X1FYP8_9SPHN|nr:aminotransferase class I/II-fold pyridoxal phosphate-dependent enzyme [Novosphingobium piscinae]MBC2669361.1 aminotransferase class I/II-fold pyridoxal phosphate-dependent enzyme [Novosphingobium piscinae]
MDQPALSRRHLLGAASLAGALAPALGTAGSALAAAPAPDSPEAMIAGLTDGIYINANENPLGPCPAALAALQRLPALSGRYGMPLGPRLGALFARQHGLPAEAVAVHAGSYVPLRAAGLAFSSAERPIAYFEPTFDSGFLGANGKPLTGTVTLPLDGQGLGDPAALLAAAPNAGIYYLCNPNNPTGTITPRSQIEALLARKPQGSILLVDEAYIHYSDAPSCLDLVAKGADVLVLRTFSKIYGLAGLRIGLVAGRPDLLAQLDRYANNFAPLPAIVAAEASLLDPALIPTRRAENTRVRRGVEQWLDARGVRYLPSATNFMMIHVGRPGGEVQAALARERVFISGPRKHMPNWVRISIGTAAEMERFKLAFGRAMGLA